jgi:hypothetical protein
LKKWIDTDKFIEMYQLGYTHQQLCKEFNLCPASIINKIKELGLPPRKKTLSVDIEEFSAAYCSGLSSRQLAKEFGICTCTVYKLVKELRLREGVNATQKMECYVQVQ